MSCTRPTRAGLLLAALAPWASAHAQTGDDGRVESEVFRARVSYAEDVPTDRLAVYTLRVVSPAALSDMTGAAAAPVITHSEGSRLTAYTPRREMGFQYSSDGRLSAYVSTRETAAPTASGTPADCCANGTAAVASGATVSKQFEGSQSGSLLAQLRKRGLRLKLDDGWQLTSGAHTRQYESTGLTSRIGYITLGKWWGALNVSYSLQAEKRGNTNFAPSQAVRMAYSFGPTTAVSVAYTTGEEIAFFGERGLLKTEVRGVALRAEHGLRKEWSMTFDAGQYQHGPELPTQRVMKVAVKMTL